MGMFPTLKIKRQVVSGIATDGDPLTIMPFLYEPARPGDKFHWSSHLG